MWKGSTVCAPSTCLAGLPLQRRVGPGGRRWLDQGWGPRASEEILRTSRGAASHTTRGHAGSASSEPLRARRPADWGGSRRARSAKAALPRRGWPGTGGRAPTSPLWVSAGHLQLTSLKFGAPARWPRRVLPRVRRAGGGPLSRVLRPDTRRVRRPRCWRRGFKETAPSPQFVDPRWGCSRFPDCRGGTGDPFPAPAAAATPPRLPRRRRREAGALGTSSGECGYLRVLAPGAGAGCACPAAAESVYIWGHVEEVEPRTP